MTIRYPNRNVRKARGCTNLELKEISVGDKNVGVCDLLGPIESQETELERSGKKKRGWRSEPGAL